MDWPFNYDDFEPYYVKAEHLVGLNGTVAGQAKKFSQDSYQKPRPPNPISEFARLGMEKLGLQTYRTPLAVITEDHAPSGRKAGDPKVGYVNRYGDPLGYKSNTWVSLLRPTILEKHDLELRPNCVVTHLEASGRTVSKVHYRDPSGRPRSVSGKTIVVACSAIESVRLLMLSAEEDRQTFGSLVRYQEAGGLLGRFFLTHAFGGAEVQIKGQRFDKSISLDSDYATDSCASDAFLDQHGLWAGGAIYNNTSDQCLPITMARTEGDTDLDFFWGGFMGAQDHTSEAALQWLNGAFGSRLSAAFMANQVPRFENRIELHPSVRDKWNRKCGHIIKNFHPHDHAVMDVFAEVCRQIMVNGVPEYTELGFGSVYGNAVRIANHILGGARFASTRDLGVLDPNCRVWDSDNLYVTDGSFMPTSGGANPTLTIQANAFRVADHLKQV
jgi:choline dehydrogenase-like flavoprotein